jgi:kinetochore protein Spc25, fungi type
MELYHAVPTVSPALPTLPILLDELNESRDIFAFFRAAEREFRALLA